MGESARQYYAEVYTAGGLDRTSDEFVCFDDDQKLETFFVFSQSSHLKELLLSAGR